MDFGSDKSGVGSTPRGTIVGLGTEAQDDLVAQEGGRIAETELDGYESDLPGVSSVSFDELEESEVDGQGSSLARSIEAILIVSSEPVSSKDISLVLDQPETVVIGELGRISRFYADSGRGFRLDRIAGGYQIRTSPDTAAVLERFLAERFAPRLSAAALEALAVVAYKQPVSRAMVTAIRGVNSDGVMKLLLSRGYIRVSGRDRGPGQSVLYSTTQLFLERLGLDSLADLDPLSDFVPSTEVLEAIEASLMDRD